MTVPGRSRHATPPQHLVKTASFRGDIMKESRRTDSSVNLLRTLVFRREPEWEVQEGDQCCKRKGKGLCGQYPQSIDIFVLRGSVERPRSSD